MKIVFVISGLNAGGAENMLLRLIERIDRAVFSFQVISLTSLGEIGPKIMSMGVPVEALDMRPGWRSLLGFFRLVRRLRQIKPDLVHTWMYHADFLGGLAAKLAMVPGVVWCVRSSDFLHSGTRWSTRLILALCARVSSWMPSLVLYNSQKGADYHKKLRYRESYSLVIPNGIDIDQFKPDAQARLDVRRELGIPSSTSLIGLIGRYDALKNHSGFIQAAMQLHQMMPEVHFLMAGKNVDEANQELKGVIEKSGLTNYCHLLGARDDIPRVTAALDLATLASWSEAFPNVLIEAMACGVPCVSTDAGDAALILAGNGWVVPLGDMKALADQWMIFLRLNADEKRRYAERVRCHARVKFDIDVVARCYEDVYRGVKAGCYVSS